MNYTPRLFLVLFLFAASACGGTQTASDSAETYGQAQSLTLDGSDVETVTYDGAIRPRNALNLLQSSYTKTPVYILDVQEPTDVEIIANSDEADLILLMLSDDFPYQDDDTYGRNPAIQDTLPPGIYRIHVGAWGYHLQPVPFELILRKPSSEAPQTSTSTPHTQDIEEILDVASYQDIEPATPTERLAPSQAPFLEIDGETVQTDQEDIVLNPTQRLPECDGIFDTDQPVAVIRNLEGLDEDQLRVLLGQAEGRRPADTVMAVYIDNLLFDCSDDFESLFAGKNFTSGEDTGMELQVYGGVWDASSLDENEQVHIGVSTQRRTPEQWRIQTQSLSATPTPQRIGVKGRVADDAQKQYDQVGGYVRDIERPDAQITVDDSGENLQIDARIFQGDSILFVRTPSGEFLLNDDQAHSRDARIYIRDAAPGTYDVWVAQHIANEELNAILEAKQPRKINAKSTTGIQEMNRIEQTTVRARKPKNITGDYDVCSGYGAGFIDAEKPSLVLKNDSGQNANLLVRTDSEYDTILYVEGMHEHCSDDEIGHNAATGIALAPGEDVQIWVGTYEEAHAKERIDVHYLLLPENDIPSSETFIDFITP